MALRNLASKMRIPAASALRRLPAPIPCVSSPASSRALASSSSNPQKGKLCPTPDGFEKQFGSRRNLSDELAEVTENMRQVSEEYDKTVRELLRFTMRVASVGSVICIANELVEFYGSTGPGREPDEVKAFNK